MRTACCSGVRFFRQGISVVGGSETCPVFVARVQSGSPAAEAGVQSGDVLTAVDGTRVSTVDMAVRLLRSEKAKPVVLELVQDDRTYLARVRRIKMSTVPGTQNSNVLKSGMDVPLDATEQEM